MKKKSVIIIYLLLIVGFVGKAQSTYNVNFDISDFSFDENKSGISTISFRNNDFFFKTDTALPMMPFKIVKVLLPEGAYISNYEVTENKKSNIKNNFLIAKYPDEEKGESLGNQTKELLPFLKGQYPLKSSEFVTLHKMQSIRFASFIICPFRYDPESKTLSFISEFNISLNFQPDDSKNQNRISGRYDFKDFIIDEVVNPEEYDSFYGKKLVSTKSVSLTTECNYLIITSDALVEDFLPLKSWKIRKGLTSEIITTNEIYSNYAGATNQLKIKNCIFDYMANRNTMFVLLGGDVNIVPVQGCYAQVGSITDIAIPTDLFYACFDNDFAWNADGDNLVGEYTDNVDLDPEITISRVPVRTSADVTAVLNKTLIYEQEAQEFDYVNYMLLAGAELHYNVLGIGSDAHIKSEILYNDHIDPYWSGYANKFYDTGTSFFGSVMDPNYDLTTPHLQEKLNYGYHFVHMHTHGVETAWTMEGGASQTAYHSSNASNLVTSNASIVISASCLTNAFDSNESLYGSCLSEALMRNPEGGSVCYWGGSRTSWGHGSLVYPYAYGPDIQYSISFFNKLLQNDIFDFGETAALAKAAHTTVANLTNDVGEEHRWQQFSYNALGDPNLTIFTSNPNLGLENCNILKNGTTIDVSTNNIQNCKITVSSMDYGNSYFEVHQLGSTSSTTFLNVNVPCYVTVSKHNYRPYVHPADVFVQDVTYSADAYITGDNIYFGRNVSSNFPIGNVKINIGSNVIINSEGEVVFEKGFELESGAKLDVTVN